MLPSFHMMMKQQHPLGSRNHLKNLKWRGNEKSAAGSYLFIARIGVPLASLHSFKCPHHDENLRFPLH